MRLFFTLVLCLFIGGFASQVFAENGSSDATKALVKKSFRMEMKNGKQTMILIKDDALAEDLGIQGYGKDCITNVAQLNLPEAANVVQEGEKILAFLECPRNNDGQAETVIAIFESKNTNVPLCFDRINLMDLPSRDWYYYGRVGSVTARKLPNGNFFVVAHLSGGDAGNSWDSPAILHIDAQCRPTLLAQFYDGVYSERDDGGISQGTSLKYKFASDYIIQIEKFKVKNYGILHEETRISRKRLDLNALLRNPKLRTFEPKP
jgi:hypothetical protein